MNLTAFRTRISSEIGLDNTAASAEQLLIDGWLNEAVEQFLTETGVRRSVAIDTLTAGIGDYELPIEALALKHVIVVDSSGNGIPLDPLGEDEILVRRQYVSVGDTPRYYALQGANLLMLYPTPSSVLTIRFYYVPKPASPLAVGADDPSMIAYGGIPTQFHPLLEAYGKWKAASYDDDASAQDGLVYRDEWEKGIVRAKARLNKMKGRLAPARPGRRRRFPVRPGIDVRY